MGFYTVDKYGFPVPGGNVSGNLPPGPWSQEVRALYAPPSSAGGMEASQAKMRRMFEMRKMMMEQMRMRAGRDWSGMAQMGGFAGPKEGIPKRDFPMLDFYGPQSRMQPQQVQEVMQQQSLPRGGY